MRGATHNLIARTRPDVALYVLNQKRAHLRSAGRALRHHHHGRGRRIGRCTTGLCDRSRRVGTHGRGGARHAERAPPVTAPLEEEDDLEGYQSLPESEASKTPRSPRSWTTLTATSEPREGGVRQRKRRPAAAAARARRMAMPRAEPRMIGRAPGGSRYRTRKRILRRNAPTQAVPADDQQELVARSDEPREHEERDRTRWRSAATAPRSPRWPPQPPRARAQWRVSPRSSGTPPQPAQLTRSDRLDRPAQPGPEFTHVVTDLEAPPPAEAIPKRGPSARAEGARAGPAASRRRTGAAAPAFNVREPAPTPPAAPRLAGFAASRSAARIPRCPSRCYRSRGDREPRSAAPDRLVVASFRRRLKAAVGRPGRSSERT